MTTKREILRDLRDQLHNLHMEEDRIAQAISDTVEEIEQVRRTPADAYDLGSEFSYELLEEEEGRA